MLYHLPDTFDSNRSEKYVLSIRIHDKGCSFALYDPLVDGSYYYQEVTYNKKQSGIANFKEFFFANSFLALPYRKLQIISYSPNFTCVPSAIYEEEEKEKIYAFNFMEKEGKVLSHHLPQSGLHLIHSMDVGMYEFIHRSLSNPQFIHHTAPLVTFFQGRSRMGNVKKMIVNPQKDSVDILCFSQSELQLVNNFACKDPEDMVYYILYTWKHLKLDQLKDHVLITGESDIREYLMEQLARYIKHTLPYNVVPEYHLAGIDAQSIPFDQLSLSLCEL